MHTPRAIVGGGRQVPADAGAAVHTVEARLASLIRAWTAKRLADGDPQALYAQMLELIEPPLFETCLETCDNQCATAARRLGLHRSTLRKKLDGYGLGD